MLTISATDDWRAAHPGAFIGLLEASGIANDRPCPALDTRKREIEAGVRARYGGLTRRDLLALPVMAAYDAHYKRFNKTYHVQLQVESIALKGRSLPNVSPAVDANFAAEVETLVLTAGHDVDRLQGTIQMDVSRAGDQMVQMNGTVKDLRPGDMIMRDARGISCSIIYGQDNESPISPRSTRVLYVAYAPAGVAAGRVELQLRLIEENLRLCSPAAVVEQCRLLRAQAGR
jgi:DNA/RNA-binding domain of Phe-tRNA-synthetase-like protein